MTIAQTLLAELQHEAVVTRKMLERVPFEQLDWQPHEKSMTLLRIAQHIAYIPTWIQFIMNADELDLAAYKYDPLVPSNAAELLEYYNENLKRAEELLSSCSDEDIVKPWTLRKGDHIVFSLPKVSAIRSFTMNHGIHHRGQLSVYLRLLGVPVPGAYGPSADD